MAAAAASSAAKQQLRWVGAVKQVTKSNFSEILPEIRAHIADADFVALSMKKTGDCSISSSQRHPWHRVLPFDTPQTAYLKAKLAAESFEILQLAVCPFRLLCPSAQRSKFKLLAYPYNFHLFPRDELNLGMPSYSFSCQTSVLTSMAKEGFDFNVCIYNGISYLSRAQESVVKCGKPMLEIGRFAALTSLSVADSIFRERIKSRVLNWRKACKESDKSTSDSLVLSLRKLICGVLYGSRPCMSIDVCSDRQVQLALQIVHNISDELVPIVIHDKGGQPKTVQVVLTSSEEDKNLLRGEVQAFEDEENMKLRGFREVIDLISRFNKPVVGFNCLHDFAFIHSKFICQLPPSTSEFMCSLRMAFPNILDIHHLLKEFGPWKKGRSITAALSYLKRLFPSPIEMEIPQQWEGDTDKNCGHDVLRLTRLFVKLNTILKVVPDGDATCGQSAAAVESYANIFYPTCTSIQETGNEENVGHWMGRLRKVGVKSLVFLWGFANGTSVVKLKHILQQVHPVFSSEFEIQFVDMTCAVVVFSEPGSAKTFLKDMESEGTGSSTLGQIMQEGIKATGFDTYKKVCGLGFWDAYLGDSLEKVLSENQDNELEASTTDATEVFWHSVPLLDLDEL